MSLNLVIARCGRNPMLMGDVDALDARDREALEDAASFSGSASLVQVLPSGGWAVGRRVGAKCTWWIARAPFLAQLDPPHALLTAPALFEPDGDGKIPGPLDLVALVAAIEPFGGASRAAKLVAGVVRALREGGPPVAVRTDASFDAQEALALVVVAVVGRELSVAVGHPSPDPARYRLAIGVGSTEGFVSIDAVDPPDEGEDLVAWFARDRLREDPSALADPGGLTEAGVRELLRAGGVSAATSREGAVRAMVARLRAGAPLTPELTDELVALTVESADARPWAEVARRPSVVRQAAVLALLDRASAMRPTEALLEAIGRMYPRGAPLAPWCAALLGWLRKASRPLPIVARIEEALLDWPQSAARANRVSLWTEVVRVLVEREHFQDAVAAVSGPVVHAMIDEGSGAAIATIWGTLPADRRNPRRLGALVERLARDPRGDRAAAQILRHVHHSAAEVDALFKAWLRTRGASAVDATDALFLAVVGTEHAGGWLREALATQAVGAVLPALERAAKGPEDPVWIDAELAASHALGARERFVGLRLFANGAVALEPLARGLVEGALIEARFPDAALSEAARVFVDVPMCSPVWAWVAVAAAAPLVWSDEIVDGTVFSLCERPPSHDVERRVCALAAEALGAAADWEPLDHARWIVRFALAPDGDHTGFPIELVRSLIAGLIGRFDAGPHLGRVVAELLALPEDHPALTGLLGDWLVDAWAGRVPRAFVEAVEARGVPPGLADAWNRLVD